MYTDRSVTVTIKQIGRVLLGIAATTYIALIAWGPNSEPARSVHLLLGFAAFMCIAALISSFATPRDFTIVVFASIGTTLGIGVLGIFGLGLFGLIPPILLVPGTWCLRDRLDGNVVIPATVTCCVTMVSPILVAFI